MASKVQRDYQVGSIIGAMPVERPTFHDPGQDALTRAVCNHHRREQSVLSGCLDGCPLKVCVRTMANTDGLRKTLEEIRNGKI